MNPERARAIYDTYASGVAWVETAAGSAGPGLGTAFHLGSGQFVTAGHVARGSIVRAGTTAQSRHIFKTELGLQRTELSHEPGESEDIGEPHFHPKDDVDLAVVEIRGVDAAVLPMVNEESEAGERLTLLPVLVMGYPRVPGALDPPPLLASRTEISGTAEVIFGGPKAMLLGAMARGGFSGGPVLSREGKVLGMMIRSLVTNDGQTELGFLSALQSEAIRECLDHHDLDIATGQYPEG